jgi:hypothetical protein
MKNPLRTFFEDAALKPLEGLLTIGVAAEGITQAFTSFAAGHASAAIGWATVTTLSTAALALLTHKDAANKRYPFINR